LGQHNIHSKNPTVITLFSARRKEKESIWTINFEGNADHKYKTICVGNEHILQNPESHKNSSHVIKTAMQCSYEKIKFGDITSDDFKKVESELKQELDQVFHEEDVQIIQQQCWGEFLILMDTEDIGSEYPWKLLELQSESNIWFIGTGSITPLIPNILSYNLMLLDMHGIS
jgi:hypothetical protein